MSVASAASGFDDPLVVLQQDVGRIAVELSRLVPAAGSRLSPPAAHLTGTATSLSCGPPASGSARCRT